MRLLPLALATILATPALAQDPVFDSYDAMRADMDGLIMARDIQPLMLRFGGADEMTPVQLDQIDRQVEQIYPVDFENVALLRRTVHEGGFAQEIVAYWTGLSYIYAYVLYHERDGKVVSINYRFNSDFNALNSLF